MEKRPSIALREERTADHRETETVIREAFWNQYVPGCVEHYLMRTMRDHADFASDLDFVAIDNDRIVGMVAYSHTKIQDADGKTYSVLGLGPIAVLPEYQGKGIGGKLITHTQSLARNKGYRAIFLLGDPDYYSHYGFLPAEQFGIRTSDDMYADALQVFPLYENALLGISGKYIEGPIYEFDENAVTEFDKSFPEKEALSGTPAQIKFEKIVARQRPANS